LLLVGALVPPSVSARDDGSYGGNLDPEVPHYIVPDIEVEAFGLTMELAALVDYQQMANEDGVSLEETINKYHWQKEFARVATDLADAYPNEFAGAAVVEQSSAGWIAFKGSVPVEAASLIASVAKPVTLIGNRGFSQEELAVTLEQNYHPMIERSEVVDGYGTSDPESGVITITLQPSDGLSLDERLALLEELTSDVVRSNLSIDVNVVLGGAASEMLSHYRGGAHAFMNGPSSWCTWGFNVIPTDSSGGGHGIAIARHCDESTGASTARYHVHGNSSSGTLTRVRYAVKGLGDMAFYRTSGHVVDGAQFYYDWRALRTVTRVDRPFGGLRLCAYGRTTGYKCNNEVYRLNECAGLYCRLAMTHRNRHEVGDSGGPWFSGTTAYGLTSHRRQYLLIWRDLFTPVSPNLQDLQVRVRTG
jgi:hypothetical protein